MVYQPKGRQVGLSGPVSTGFQPVRAADRSQIVANAGQDRIEKYSRASEAYVDNLNQTAKDLAGFSDTLNKFLFDQAKINNENEYKLGLADVLNGDLQPKPELAQDYHDKVAILKESVIEEDRINQKIEEASPGAALQQKADSPVLSGWRAYGAAVGRAKLAAVNSQTVMGELMMSDQKIVPIQQPDGSVKMIAPSEARSPAEWQAAWAVSLQAYINQAGIANLNPIILAEELTPTMLSVKGNLFSNHMAMVRKVMKEEAFERASISVVQGVDLLDVNDQLAVDNFWQQASSDMQIGTGLTRGEANAKAIDLIVSRAKITRNEALLEAIASSPLIADQPNGVTVGQMYGEVFEQAASFIREDRERVRQETEREMDEAVDGITTEFTLGLLSAKTPEETAQLRQSAMQALTQLAGLGNQKAAATLMELSQQEANYNPLRAQDIARDLRADPYSHSMATIQEELRRGNINGEEANRLQQLLPGNESREAVKEFDAEIKRLSRGMFASILAEEGIAATDAGSVTALMEGQLSDELNTLLLQFIQQNPNASSANVRDFLTQKANDLIKQPRFRPVIRDGKVVNAYQLSRGGFQIPTFRNPATGADTRDFTAVPPATIRTERPRVQRDYVISPQELAKAQEDLMNGKQPGGRINQVMQATGLSAEELIRSQSKAYGIPLDQKFDQSTAIQSSRARQLLAPGANAILTNPNATRAQRIRAWADIGIAKQRAARARQQAATGGGPDLAPGSTVTMDDYIRLGAAQGLSGNELITFAAVGMAESTGSSGVVNNNPATGDNSYGLWQINMIGSLGPERIRQYGLRSADDLKDPETNARVAAQLLRSSGLSAWGAYTDGRYRQYLAEASRAYNSSRRSGGRASSNVQGSSGYVGSNQVRDIGLKDQQGRPIKMSPAAGQAWQKMVQAGMPFNPADVTSSYRDESEYVRLKRSGYNPASNSAHNHGEGIDVHGAAGEWLKKNGARYGWRLVDYPGSHGGHFEYRP